MTDNSPDDKADEQDMDLPAILIGCDVVGLYPALETVPTSFIAYQSIRELNVKVHDINYNRALVFLILAMGMSNMIRMGLGPYLLTQKDHEFTAKSLSAKKNRSLEGWSIFKKEMSDGVKREIFARVVQVCSIILMTTHAYQFGGKIFRQRQGAPIGIRASAVLAELCMACWDRKRAVVQNNFELIIHLMFRYIDDIRVFL